MTRLATLLALSAVLILTAFALRPDDGGEPTLPDTPYNYAAIALPSHLVAATNRLADNTPRENTITDAGATLGRVLFYDKRLSLNQTTACASCHHQDHGFSDTTSFSTGFNGEKTERNAMSLSFSRFYQPGRFFWDERAETLEEQTVMPIEDPIEMGMTLEAAVARLEATNFYPSLFDDAFGSPEITPDRMSRALAQFVRSIVAPNSRYDEERVYQGGRTGQPLPNFTSQENRGLQLFFGEARCSECHGGDLQITDRPFSNGLDASITDSGVRFGLFKVGSLRNIELTAPYMHDGRFETLEEVVEHYNSEIKRSPGLFVGLRDSRGQPIRLNLSEKDRAAIVAFLKTLTDETLATDELWSDPFPVSEEE